MEAVAEQCAHMEVGELLARASSGGVHWANGRGGATGAGAALAGTARSGGGVGLSLTSRRRFREALQKTLRVAFWLRRSSKPR